jgi:hypothetical protein
MPRLDVSLHRVRAGGVIARDVRGGVDEHTASTARRGAHKLPVQLRIVAVVWVLVGVVVIRVPSLQWRRGGHGAWIGLVTPSLAMKVRRVSVTASDHVYGGLKHGTHALGSTLSG